MTEPMVKLLALRDRSDLQESLYAAVGWTMRIWAMVENELAHILHHLIDGKGDNSGKSRQAYSIFYSIQNLRPRIDLVDAAFHNRTDVPPTVHKKWKKIVECISKESIERNQIVHGSYMNGYNVRTHSLGFWISPKIFSDLHRKDPPRGIQKQGYETEDIERHALRVDLLRHALWHLQTEAFGGGTPGYNTAEEYLAAWSCERQKREWPSP